MKKIAFLALAALALMASPAAAETKTHATAKIQMDVPTGWKMQSKGDVMSLADPTDELGFVFIVTDAKELDKVVARLDKEVGKIASDITWKKKQPEPLTLNGMKGLGNKGTGKVSGKSADLALLLIRTPADKVLLILGAVESSRKDAHKAEVQKFIASIKPAS
jgi:predicted Zn-dependent protease